MHAPAAIITGAGRGIGRAVALELSNCGYRLALASRNQKQLEAVAKQAQLRESDKAFLRKVQGFYEEFARSQGDTELARRDRADGCFRVATIVRLRSSRAW